MTRSQTDFVLRGWGAALPERRLGNEELGAALGVDPESILARTGIVERRVASAGDCASSLGARAARVALARGGLDPAVLDLVLLSTYTPDFLLCPTAPRLAHAIGAHRAGAFDLNAACSGGVTALVTASAMLASGVVRNALVVTADLTTLFVRPDDDKTRLVFGDGSAALLLERPSETGPPRWRVLSSIMGADGSGDGMFQVAAGGSVQPLDGQPVSAAARCVSMNGRAIFRFGVEQGARVVKELCDRAGLSGSDVRWIVPHQANLRIISSLIERTAVPAERWYVNIERFGNTASASVPLALTELLDNGSIAPGDVVLLVAFGAGLTWSGVALRAG
jgi:3-oxoacyl-[acyl-carrier-protein] synthase-3